MTTFYWTDDQLNKYVDGVITSYAPPGGPPSGGAVAVAFSCAVPDDGIAVFGVTERHSGMDALGWRVDDDLVETNDFWVSENGDGVWLLPDTDAVSGYFISAYEGVGANFDPDTGYIFLTGVWRRFDMPGFTNQREHAVLVIDPATDSIVNSDVLTFSGTTYQPSGIGSSAEGGQVILGRKLYYSAENNADSIVEYDLDTGATRKSTNCFQAGRIADFNTRLGDATGLWQIDDSGWTAPYDVYLCRFEVGDIPWGVSGTLAVPSDEYILFRDDFEGLLSSHVNGFCFLSANEIVYQCDLVDNGNTAWIKQTINPLGAPEVLIDLGDDWYDSHTEVYSTWAPAAAPLPNLAGLSLAGRRSFDP